MLRAGTMKRSKNLRETATKEQGIFAPDGSIPAHEMLGDIFSDMGQPEQALAEYEAKLKLSPIIVDSIRSMELGKTLKWQNIGTKTAGFYEQLVKLCAGETQPVRRLPMHRLLFPRSLSKTDFPTRLTRPSDAW
jgi:hypothetical protein